MQNKPGGTEQVADPLRWRALGVVLVASFMILLDISIVNVAIPTIQTNIHTTNTEIEFVLVGYQMSYALMLITGGRLGDIFGRKRLFMLGVAGFTLASAACGFSQSGVELVIARIVQGLFAALMYPQVLSVIQVSFPPKERGAAFGMFGAVIGVATISGPLVGGILIKLGLLDGWRPIYLVNVPIGIGALFAASRMLHESKSPNAQRLDIPGTILATLALFLLVYPIVEGRDADWAPWTFISMVASVPVFVVFAMYNARRAKGAGNPLIEPALFGSRAFVVGLLVTAVFFAGIPSFFLTFSLWLQVGHLVNVVPGYGFDAFAAGLTTLPFSLCSAVASGMSIRLAPKIGKVILQIGSVLFVVGMGLTLWIVHNYGGVDFHSYYLIPALGLSGLGLGCVAPPLINIVLAGIHHGHAGSASGVLTTTQQLGGALGVAIVGVFFFGSLKTHAPVVSATRETTFQATLVSAGLPAPAAQQSAAKFTYCFDATAAEKDQTVVPPGCPNATHLCPASTNQPVAVAFCNEVTVRQAVNFTHAFETALVSDIVIFAAVFLLVFFLPKASLGRGGPPVKA